MGTATFKNVSRYGGCFGMKYRAKLRLIGKHPGKVNIRQVYPRWYPDDRWYKYQFQKPYEKDTTGWVKIKPSIGKTWHTIKRSIPMRASDGDVQIRVIVWFRNKQSKVRPYSNIDEFEVKQINVKARWKYGKYRC